MVKRCPPKGIALIGFMGTGKTTIGKELSERLNKKLVDVDIYIQKNMEMSIKEIFSKYGEASFRKIESGAIRSLKDKLDILMDCGGGACLDPENVINIKENNILILLEASPETISKRVENDTDRKSVV